MGVLAMGLKKSDSLGVLGLDKVLNVASSLFSFFELSSYVDHSRDLTPLLQELLSVYLGVVVRTYDHACL